MDIFLHFVGVLLLYITVGECILVEKNRDIIVCGSDGQRQGPNLLSISDASKDPKFNFYSNI